MKLSKYGANSIVKELNSIIDEKVNMMNERGIIIASSDVDRVGELHQGAQEILEKGLDELIIDAKKASGTMKEGVNYPLRVYETVIGVVGITGPCEEVRRYGLIAKKMTEILLREMQIRERELFDENMRNRYIAEWLQSENMNIDKDFLGRGARMKIDITVPRRFMVITIGQQGDVPVHMEEMELVEECEKRIKLFMEQKESASLYLKTASELVVGIKNRTNHEMQEVATTLLSITQSVLGARVQIGIDDGCQIYSRAQIAYGHARKAAFACGKRGHGAVCFYGELDLELVLDEVKEATKQEYVHKIFSQFDDAQLLESMELLEAFYDAQGSIAFTAEKLHMHKNTIQYKLRKIKERTGYDPRSLDETTKCYLAMRFYRQQ